MQNFQFLHDTAAIEISITYPVRMLRAKMEDRLTQLGYARVSTDGQSLDAQLEALKAAGCAKVFAEKISGARSDRPQLAKAIAALGDGDVLVVTRLDRLARSTRDLLNVLAAVVERGAGFKSLRIAGRIRRRRTVA